MRTIIPIVFRLIVWIHRTVPQSTRINVSPSGKYLMNELLDTKATVQLAAKFG